MSSNIRKNTSPGDLPTNPMLFGMAPSNRLEISLRVVSSPCYAEHPHAGSSYPQLGFGDFWWQDELTSLMNYPSLDGYPILNSDLLHWCSLAARGGGTTFLIFSFPSLLLLEHGRDSFTYSLTGHPMECVRAIPSLAV
jgi:hypothetical protein